MAELIWRHPDWAPTEAPAMPGSPATLRHSVPMRVAMVGIALLCSLTGNIGNAMLAVDLPTVQGNMALTPIEGQWLLGAYTMVNCWSNLVLFKFRIQYGIRAFAQLGLTAYALLALLSIFTNDFATAVFARAASGLAAAPLFGLASLYMIQAAGPDNIQRGAMIGITLSQLASPFAYWIAPYMIDLAQPGLQYEFEAGLALCALAATVVIPLPYGVRLRVFEKMDALTVALLAPGLALVVAILSQGRLQWWFDQPWIGIALAAAIVLITAGFICEYLRRNPLLHVGWLGTPDLLRFAFGAVLVRLLTGEQTVGAVGFLRAVGMGPDQLSPLFGAVLAAALLGLLLIILVGSPRTSIPLVMLAVALIGAAALLDRDATPQDRIQNFLVSQAMIGCASTLFVGPLLLSGIARAVKAGTNHIITLIVLFAFSQTIGLQIGAAALGTYQEFREHTYSGAINSNVDPAYPIVRQRLNVQTKIYSDMLTDAGLRSAEGVSNLGQIATLNSTTRAYSDVFTILAALALLYLGLTLVMLGKDVLPGRPD